MPSFSIDPLYLQIGTPALLIGLVVGALLTWSVHRRRQAHLEAQIKNQESLQQERETAFEAANAQLTRAFTELANQSLKSNSESFLPTAVSALSWRRCKPARSH